MLHLYIGDGKGKTSAALGCALRAIGWGKRVYCAQFLKDINYASGEINAIKLANLAIKIERFKEQIHPFFCKKGSVDIVKIRRSIKESLVKIENSIVKREFDIIILDEILNALREKFVSEARLTSLIKKAKDTELIFTGRTAPSALIRLADYVSYIKKIKHPFDKKTPARRSIEY